MGRRWWRRRGGSASLCRGIRGAGGRCGVGRARRARGGVWRPARRIDRQPVAQRAKEIAFVPQWPSAMLFAESVREELGLTLRNHGLEATSAGEADRLLAELGLAGVCGGLARGRAP